MRKTFELLGVLLFLLILFAEANLGVTWRRWVALTVLLLGAVGGVLVLIWKWGH
jgi:hypothetical protein